MSKAARTFPIWIGVSLVVASSSALAYVASPSAAQYQSAFLEGQNLAQSRDAGYPLRPYTVYAVVDTLKLEAQNGAVDAVTVRTPLERTRYQSYLSVLGEDSVTAEQARARSGLSTGELEFIVFAHGLNPTDDKFLKGFSTATLRLGGQTLKPTSSEDSGVSSSQYPKTVGEIGVRFVGTLTYHFKVPATLAAARGTLSFTDPSGKKFNLTVNLNQYR